MRKSIIALSAMAAVMASCGNQAGKTVDFEKPLYTLNAQGDTLDKWIYDDKLNVIAEISKGDTISYQYNDKNQLINEIQYGDAIKYEYDANGNLTRQAFDMDEETMEYNNKNQITAYTFNNRGKDIIRSTYEYEGQKQIEYSSTMDYVEDEEGMMDVVEEKSKSIRYCIDPECKYDTLELRECNEKFENAKYKICKQWKQINGKYLETAHSEYQMEYGDYVLRYSVTNEYDQNGLLTKYSYKTADNPEETTTYKIEGNKVTDSKGNVSVFMER